MIQNLYEPIKKSPLCLVLTGMQNTGKTEWLRRLIPDELAQYVANSQLEHGKDDEILLTNKLLIIDDEFSGKSKRDAKKMKNTLSMNSLSVRRPYAEKAEQLDRIATFAGTCNESDVLVDSTGNRRFIVIEFDGTYDFDSYNRIDKNQLLAQAAVLYNAGHTADLMPDLLKEMTEASEPFYEASSEDELLAQYYNPTEEIYGEFMSATMVKNALEEKHPNARLSLKKLGSALHRQGFKRKQKRVSGKNMWGYFTNLL